jgi:hypothetical protein
MEQTLDPGERPPISWSSALAVLKKQDVPDSDPRIAQCRAMLAYWRIRRVTDAEIDSAIMAELAVLDETGDGDLVLWSRVTKRVPGGFWAKAGALLRLRDAGRAYVGLADEADAEVAANARALNRSRPIRVVETGFADRAVDAEPFATVHR